MDNQAGAGPGTRPIPCDGHPERHARLLSDGGRHNLPDGALSHGLRLLEQGAHILDVGGESTRPGSEPVPAGEERARVLPAVRAVLAARPQAVISVDTVKAAVAAEALEAGALIVNDVSACAADPALLDVLVQHKPGYVLMHAQGTPKTMQRAPRYDDVVEDVARFFDQNVSRLVRAGLPQDRIALDPGIGFGKTLEHNLSLLRALGRFALMGFPVLVGLSRKSFLGALLGLEVDRRGPATQVATALAHVRGAFVHRVHQVDEAMQALRLAEALC